MKFNNISKEKALKIRESLTNIKKKRKKHKPKKSWEPDNLYVHKDWSIGGEWFLRNNKCPKLNKDNVY